MDDAWDKLAPFRHYQTVEQTDFTFSEVLLPSLFDVLKRQANHGTFTVLDVGCGTGFLMRVLANQVHRIVGIDPSAISIKMAKETLCEKSNATVEQKTIQEYAINHENQFDFAIAHMSLQALQHLDTALESVSVCLKDQGGFLFTIPHPCFWALIKDEIAQQGYSYHVSSSHMYSFPVSDDRVIQVPYFHRPLETYSSALSSAGFVIEQMIEPYPTVELMRRYRREWTYPGFLMALCRNGGR